MVAFVALRTFVTDKQLKKRRKGFGALPIYLFHFRNYTTTIQSKNYENWVKVFLFCIASLAFISCDRVTKNMAKEQLKNQEPFSYFPIPSGLNMLKTPAPL